MLGQLVHDRIQVEIPITDMDGDHAAVRTADRPARFLLASGRPLHEPIARYGPFVMNTRQEIEQALRDLRNDTFVYQD